MRVALVIVLLVAAVANAQVLRDRQEFAARMGQVNEHMTMDQVRLLLGPPDDALTSADPEMSGSRAQAKWCYGTNGHRTFATLGTVTFKDGKVNGTWVWLATRKPSIPDLVGLKRFPPGPERTAAANRNELELQRLMRIVASSPCIAFGANCDPPALIRAANALEPLGKEKALAVLSEYARVVGPFNVPECPNERVALILRALFDVPTKPGFMFEPGFGVGSPPQPTDRTLAPRYPLALVDDVPLVLVWGGYQFGGGMPESAESQIGEFAKNCRIRSEPLRPTNDPLSVYSRLMASPQWSGEADRSLTISLQNQLLRLIRTAYRASPNRNGKPELEYNEPASGWTQIVDGVAKLGIRWDGWRQCYVLKNGNTVPEERAFDDSVQVWEPKVKDIRLRVWVHRTAPNRVDAEVRWEEPKDATIHPARVLVYRDGEKQPLRECVILARPTDVEGFRNRKWSTAKPWVGIGSSGATAIVVNVPPGTVLRIGFEVKGQTGPIELSPKMRF